MSLVISIRNKSALAPISDYDYVVRVGDGTKEGSREIAAGEIKGHKRADGWQILVQRVLDHSDGS